MGKRGPKKTPTPTLKLRASRLPENRRNEPEFDPSTPIRPDFLNGIAVKEWNRVVDKLVAAGVVCDLDSSVLALYCQAWSEYLEADKLVTDSGGVIVTTVNGNTMINPANNVRISAWNRVLKAAAEFGLTPSARAGMSVTKPEKKGNKKGRFFGA